MSDIQAYINNTYNKYKISKKGDFESYCFPKTFKLQNPQMFLSEYMKDSRCKNLLVYHQIGSGKTCTALLILKTFLNLDYDVYFICPASLKSNVYKEIKSQCLNKYWSSLKDFKDIFDPKYIALEKQIDEEIKSVYKIMSYHKFVKFILDRKQKVKKSIFVLDEVQNIISSKGVYYKVIDSFFKKGIDHKTCKIILLSGTPVFNQTFELALMFNLLQPITPFPANPVEFGKHFIGVRIKEGQAEPQVYLKNKKKITSLLDGHISYFKGAPDFTFPKTIVHLVRCIMSDYQEKCYTTFYQKKSHGNSDDNFILSLSNTFLLGLRMLSNICFPNYKINKKGCDLLKISEPSDIYPVSTKFYFLINKIIKNDKDLFLVYSNFKIYSGILTITKILDYLGFVLFTNSNKDDKKYNYKRYAVLSGNETLSQREMLQKVFNHPTNKNGHNIRIILCTPAMKEGVSFVNISQVHIIEPYWNVASIKQVIGRAVRYCSHKTLKEKDRKVHIYIYLAIFHPDKKTESTDERIFKIAQQKQKIIRQLENVMKKSAIDKSLFQT
ncbi:putative VV D11-like helicase [Namao virus]|nr:putative VV D11-like helicase [Namao virus]